VTPGSDLLGASLVEYELVTEAHQTRRALTIFKRALSVEAAELGNFLDSTCAADAELRAVVERMLRADEADAPLADTRQLLESAVEREASIPRQIGQYTILRRIGAGGMGIVYEAEQDSPRRRVALKVLSSGWFDDDRRRRFEREIEVLGRMRHPGIAQVFEGGTLELGQALQPYIAMELIEGLELLEHVERSELSRTARLELVASIADAAQHAHERGVVHRDLKPANILVDGDGQVKLLDFGVAQVSGSAASRGAALTRAGDIVGTLSYMSPEQAAGRPEEVDTRADVYAIGVLLYRVLAGRLPYEVDDLPLDEALRVVRHGDPAPLPPGHGRDLATIVDKALAKEKAARYASASELAADIRRLLRNEPIAARPPSAIYHLKKLSQRHKGAAAGVLFVLALLVATTVFSLEMAGSQTRAAKLASDAELEAGRQRDEALAARDDAEAVADFLLRTIESVRPGAEGRAVPLREVLEPMALQTARAFEGNPRVEAELWRTLGTSFGALGELQRALDYKERALELLTEELDPEHPKLWRVRTERALCLQTLGRRAEAEEEFLAALPTARAIADDDFRPLYNALHGLSLARRDQNRLEEAEEYARECLALTREHLGQSHGDLLLPAMELAVLLEASGRADEARDMLEELYAQAARELGSEHPDVYLVATSLAQAYLALDEKVRAEELMLVALEGNRRVLGDDHPATIDALVNLAANYQDRGQGERAEPLLAEAVERNARLLGTRSMTTLALRHNLAVLHASLGRSEEAAADLALLVEDTRGLEGLEWLHGIALSKYGASAWRMGNYDEAEQALLDGFEILEREYGLENTRTRIAIINLIELYDALGDHERVTEWRAVLPARD